MSKSTNSATVTDSLTVAADQAAFEVWLRTFPACLTPFAVGCGGRDDLRAAVAASSRTQHDADSKELRSLCAARDAARKEVTALRAQLEEERARNAAMVPVAWMIQVASRTEFTTNEAKANLANNMRYVVTPLAIIPGAKP